MKKIISRYDFPDNIGGGVLRRKEGGTGLNCLPSLISREGGQRRKAEKPMLIDSVMGVTL